MHNQKKHNKKFKNKKQPELPENQTVWKSDNHGVKEEIFIQTSRRCGDRKLGQRVCMARGWLVEQVVPYLSNWGARQTTQPRVPVQENKASRPVAEKTCGGCSSGRNSQTHRRVHWRDPQGPRMYTSPATQESVPEESNLPVGSGGSD